MRVPLEWLSEFVEGLPEIDELCEGLTLAGLEVEDVVHPDRRLVENLVFARLLAVEPHPNADRLSLCTVDSGGEEQRIVCGATNMAAGDSVVLARPGAVLPGGVKIKKAKIRGVESCGMLCSASELELYDDHAGILIVHEAPSPGTPAAQLLAEGKVVARAAGRMEYGPRALGNRTLFASCSDATINQWLNEKLQRTEFMPFAPIIMAEHAHDYFPDWKPEHVAARFMTITYDASDLAKQSIPAAIHVDGTARPQVLRQQDNPEVHALLTAYYDLTGVPALINTSFNMHEEPIVCSAADAVRAFQLGHLDALICADWLAVA